MAFLLPESIPSRSDLPARLRMVARSLRDFAPDEVTVWLRKSAEGESFLVVLEPRAGIAVIDVPLLSVRRRSKSSRIFESIDKVSIASAVVNAAEEFEGRIDAQAISRLPVRCVIAVPTRDDLPRERLTEGDRELPILTQSDLNEENLMAALQRVFDGECHDPLSDQEENIARAVVNPEIILRRHSNEQLPLFSEPEIVPEETVRVMDRRQEHAARYLNWGYRVIRGVAGSGKTLILVSRVQYLRRHWPRLRILVVTFNRVLANALDAWTDDYTSEDKALLVRNVDRLPHYIAELKGGKQLTQGGRSDQFEARMREAIGMAETLPDSQRFDVVMVDEAQDFDGPGLYLAYALLKSDCRTLSSTAGSPDGTGHFLRVYDSAQNVRNTSTAKWNPPDITAQGRTTVLTVNYRNTREVAEFAMNFLAGSSDWRVVSGDLDDPAALIRPESAKRSGPAPRVATCRDLRGEAEHIVSRVARLLAEGIDETDIVVLYGSADFEVELESAFVHQDLSYFHVQAEDGSGRKNNRDKAVHVRNKVRVSTLTGMKGLEFSRVFIGGANSINLRDVAAEDQMQATKRHLYAAMTSPDLSVGLAGRCWGAGLGVVAGVSGCWACGGALCRSGRGCGLAGSGGVLRRPGCRGAGRLDE